MVVARELGLDLELERTRNDAISPVKGRLALSGSGIVLSWRRREEASKRGVAREKAEVTITKHESLETSGK